MRKVAIIIPYYKNKLTAEENLSIMYLNKYLSKYDKFLVTPEKIRRTILKIPGVKIEKFPNKYFVSTASYSELLNQIFFYKRFSNYKYILIYQLDALVLRDELSEWCAEGLDYIGAPLFNSKIGVLTSKSSRGGNGGFSLRRVSSAIKVLLAVELAASRSSNNSWVRRFWFLEACILGKTRSIWLNAPAYDYPFNEDGFWSFEAVKYYKKFKVASFKEALRFSFERFPKKCFEMNNRTLPFGCHGWAKYSPEFWKEYLD